MSEWLLTKEEMAKAYFESENTSELPSVAIARAQLRKFAGYVQHHSIAHDFGDHTRKITVWGAEEWESLLREVGLDKEG